MRILITAGGTREKIDSVRSISNAGTGRLGSLIAECFDSLPETERIFYLCGKTALRYEGTKTDITLIGDTADLEAAVRPILEHHRIDGIIHSMAVSDYRVYRVSTLGGIAQAVISARSQEPSNPAALQEYYMAAVENGKSLDQNGKISSEEEAPVLLLKPTPKIISLFQTLAPQGLLVGFKLLDSVPYKTLIDAAYRLLQKNHCTYVLANDLRDIHGDLHKGYLIDKHKKVLAYKDKQEIAQGITKVVVSTLHQRGS
jgi:phosphopantothenate-cysteine ligase